MGDITRRIGLRANDELIARNIVDTGFSQANWIGSVNSPYIPPDIEGDSRRRGDPKTPRDYIETVLVPKYQAEQESGKARILTQQDFEPIFVSNAVPYVPLLNERGGRGGRGKGFIGEAVEEAVNIDVP